MTLRTVVADRDDDQRLLVSIALGRDPSFDVRGASGDGGEVVDLVVSESADVLVLDVDLEGLDGVEVVARVHEQRPACVCVVLSSLPASDLRAVRGSVGLVPRSTPARELATEVRELAIAVRLVEDAAGTLSVDPDRMAPREARRFVTGVLADRGLGDALDVVELLVTEVVTNAVMHARTAADIVVRLLPDAVRVEVRDADDSFPVRRRARADQPGGRGFDLVERLSRSWGIDMLEVGKSTWFEVARDPE